MNRTTDRLTNILIPGAIILVSTLFFITLYSLTVPEAFAGYSQTFDAFIDGSPGALFTLLLQLATSKATFFLISMIVAWKAAELLLAQYAQQLHGLTKEQAYGKPGDKQTFGGDDPTEERGLVDLILYGLPDQAPFKPILSIREGQVDPDGPEVMRKVGGPGFLSIGHDSAAVIARGGTIIKVLGPGWHKIGPFERVWDVVDLRPQRRNLRVETHSRDGIPIYCDAEILFRLDNGEDIPEEFAGLPYNFTPTAADNVLKVTTNKVVLKPGSGRRFTTWSTRMPNGILDGIIRDVIEQYRLDEFLAPAENGKPRFEQLEKTIEESVKAAGKKAGARVMRVTLGPILPQEEAISQQWLEGWRSEWDRVAHELQAEAKALGTEEVKMARVHAQADVITTIIEGMRGIESTDHDLAQVMILTRFMDVIRALSETDPIVRSTMFKEAEGLQRIINTMGDLSEQYTLPGPNTPPPTP